MGARGTGQTWYESFSLIPYHLSVSFPEEQESLPTTCFQAVLERSRMLGRPLLVVSIPQQVHACRVVPVQQHLHEAQLQFFARAFPMESAFLVQHPANAPLRRHRV